MKVDHKRDRGRQSLYSIQYGKYQKWSKGVCEVVGASLNWHKKIRIVLIVSEKSTKGEHVRSVSYSSVLKKLNLYFLLNIWPKSHIVFRTRFSSGMTVSVGKPSRIKHCIIFPALLGLCVSAVQQALLWTKRGERSCWLSLLKDDILKWAVEIKRNVLVDFQTLIYYRTNILMYQQSEEPFLKLHFFPLFWVFYYGSIASAL